MVLAFTGMPASGKGEAVNVARNAVPGQELPVVRMGDLIWERCQELGFELTPENVGRVANEEREKQGKDVWAWGTVARIRELLGEDDKEGTVGDEAEADMAASGSRSADHASSSNGGATTHDQASSSSQTTTPPLSPPIAPPPAAIIDGVRSMAELEVFREAFGERLRVIAITSPSSVRASRMGSRGRVDDSADEDGFRARDKRELDWGLDQVIKAAEHTVSNDGTLENLQTAVRGLVVQLVG